jgi:hypothetical protein
MVFLVFIHPLQPYLVTSHYICGIYCGISGFSREVDEICVLLGYYSAGSVNSLSTFRDEPWVQTSRVKDTLSLMMGPVGCPEQSVKNYRYTMRNFSIECRSHMTFTSFQFFMECFEFCSRVLCLVI